MKPHDPGPRRLVLVVEDDSDSLSAVVDALEDAGITALVARDGEAALALLERVSPDLILMDAIMPGLDGFETCRRLKADSGNELTPVVFMTGLDDTAHVLEGLAAGGVDYVGKPVDMNALLARIQTHIANAELIIGARRALDATGPGVVAFDERGDVAWMSEAASAVCGRRLAMLGDTERAGTSKWAAAAPRSAHSEVAPHKVRRTDGESVLFAYLGRSGSGAALASVQIAKERTDAATLSAKLGLSPREGEVLKWLADGKSNNDIASILQLSPRTVTKHLEQIYRKLGVENRTSAATMALRALL